MPRADLAALVAEAIARLDPRVIAVDLLLIDRGNDQGDAALAQVLGKRPTVIASAAVFPDATQLMETGSRAGLLARLPRAEKFLLPLQAFSDHAAVGAVNLTTDKSGTPRGAPMLFRSGDKVDLSFPLRAAALAAGTEPTFEADSLTLAGRQIAVDIDHIMPLAFYGRHRTIRTISAAAVLSGNIVPEAVRNRIVVIGATVTGGGDVFPTPFDPVMPGVEIVATAVSPFDERRRDGARPHDPRHRRPSRDRPDAAAGGFAGVAAQCGRPPVDRGRARDLGIGNFTAFAHGVWLSAALPVAAAAPPAILFGAVQLWLTRRRRNISP